MPRQRTTEPFRLKAWHLSHPAGLFYTCARPGRSLGSQATVSDRQVLDWANRLPGSADIYIVSLLGEKPGGKSEFSFYSFFEQKLSFQDWLNSKIRDRTFHVVDHPTIDLEPIPPQIMKSIAADVRRLVAEAKTVVIVDSGGWTRTGAVAAYLGAAARALPASLGLDAK